MFQQALKVKQGGSRDHPIFCIRDPAKNMIQKKLSTGKRENEKAKNEHTQSFPQSVDKSVNYIHLTQDIGKG